MQQVDAQVDCYQSTPGNSLLIVLPVLKLLLFIVHFPMGIGGASIIGHSAPTVYSSEQHAEQTYHVGVSTNTPYLGHSIPDFLSG